MLLLTLSDLDTMPERIGSQCSYVAYIIKPRKMANILMTIMPITKYITDLKRKEYFVMKKEKKKLIWIITVVPLSNQAPIEIVELLFVRRIHLL